MERFKQMEIHMKTEDQNNLSKYQQGATDTIQETESQSSGQAFTYHDIFKLKKVIDTILEQVDSSTEKKTISISPRVFVEKNLTEDEVKKYFEKLASEKVIYDVIVSYHKSDIKELIGLEKIAF